jgi:hypothetical protein
MRNVCGHIHYRDQLLRMAPWAHVALMRSYFCDNLNFKTNAHSCTAWFACFAIKNDETTNKHEKICFIIGADLFVYRLKKKKILVNK